MASLPRVNRMNGPIISISSRVVAANRLGMLVYPVLYAYFDSGPVRLRIRAILLLCAVIKDFLGKTFGVDNKQVQGVIRLAKKNGEKLGFLA